MPNLFKKRFFIPETGQWVSLRVSKQALRMIDKKGLYAYLLELKHEGVNTGVKI